MIKNIPFIDEFNKARFFDRVIKSNKCWNFSVHLSNAGYGRFRINGEEYLAHRISWKIHHGNLKNSVLVLHSCDNRRCVNPSHLFTGTDKDNMHDMISKGRKVSPHLKGEINPASKLSNLDVVKIRYLYLTGKYLQKDLSKTFKVSQAVISSVILKKTWSHVK